MKSENYDNELSMCNQLNPINYSYNDFVASFELYGEPPAGQRSNWKYTLNVMVGANIKFKPNFSAITNEIIEVGNTLVKSMDITFNPIIPEPTIPITPKTYTYELGIVDYKPCCPANMKEPVCPNCDAAPRATCITTVPNKTPIKLDLDLRIKKEGNIQNRKIPYDKARHNG